jgi:3-phenylpropionate/trans-cinnamate dioxygenase ferredoxin reductase subunit
MLHFHIRKVADGMVSSALGREIHPGHRVKLTGPYGRAFFRQGHAGRIVLVASGTGFAPMWSVAVAAIMEQPQRKMVFIVQARSVRSLYMHAALCRLALFPNVTLIPMVSEPQQISHAVQSGRPTDHLPMLTPDDVVYTAGAPAMTDAVARVAKAAGARCYTDPFVQEPRTAEQAGLMSRLTRWLNEPKSGTAPPQPAPMPRGLAAVGSGNR